MIEIYPNDTVEVFSSIISLTTSVCRWALIVALLKITKKNNGMAYTGSRAWFEVHISCSSVNQLVYLSGGLLRMLWLRYLLQCNVIATSFMVSCLHLSK